VWPLRPEPEVVADFAPPAVAWAAGHRGVDLLARSGQQVRAAQAGTVTFAGRIAGRGVVVVSHGDTRTTYEPVAASVSRGEPVRQGEVLGELELLGSHCLPRACLHWGLLRGETYLDPLTLVGRGPVRLLPWSGLPGSPAS
jgi:murein DD-endopeptidase MepM/ murein hydrolase activator NlpD